MRVGVIGAGAVGGTIAALLAGAGHEVEVTARGEHLESIRQSGIRLSGRWGEQVAHVEAGDRLLRGAELVILATKAQDAHQAIRENVPVLRGIPLVVIQNGLFGPKSAKGASPGSDIIGGLATFASSFLAPGHIAVTAGGPTYLGVPLGKDDLPARYAARILNEVMPTEVVSNFAGAQWTKLIINQVNALPAITGLSVQDAIAHRTLRRIMTLSMREAVRTGRASGVRFARVQGLGGFALGAMSASPVWLAQMVPLMMRLRLGVTPNPGSTLQSIRRGKRTEIDYLNGAVVAAASHADLTAPINAELVRLVNEVEESGTFLGPSVVGDRMRALQRSTRHSLSFRSGSHQ